MVDISPVCLRSIYWAVLSVTLDLTHHIVNSPARCAAGSDSPPGQMVKENKKQGGNKMTDKKMKEIISILNRGIKQSEKEGHYSGLAGTSALVRNATLRAVKKALNGDTFILDLICRKEA